MPVERQSWLPVASWDGLNAQMRRPFEVFTTSDRYAVLTANSTQTLALTYPMTLVESDTTAGAVGLTFPSASTVPGFRVDVVKVAGANSCTANGVTVTTRAAFVSSGAAWRQVG